MDICAALKEQYHAGLAMLAQCVQKCPDDLWNAPPTVEKGDGWLMIRSFWRIAFHAAYFTHLYLGQNADAFQPWPDHRKGEEEGMWHKPFGQEPFEFPEDVRTYSREEIKAYIGYIDSLIDSTVDQLDLDSPETGFSWYRNMTKLSHQIMNVRHIQGHIGQLSELLMQRGVDTDWISTPRP